MIIIRTRTIGLTAAAAALGVFALAAPVLAQEKKPETPKKAVVATCNSLKVQSACEARSDCNWVGEAKDPKGKVTKRAYCRANPKPKKDAKKG